VYIATFRVTLGAGNVDPLISAGEYEYLAANAEERFESMSIVHRAPRTIALLLGLLPLLAAELLCRAAGWGDFRDRPDPFAGFSRLAPAFTRTVGVDGVARFVAAEGRPSATRRLLADKPANGFRVFVFGGSTEAGTPYGYDFSFAEFLSRLLTEALPDRSVEVINCAAAGYASRRLLYLLRDPVAARAIEHHQRAEAFRAEGKLDRAREQYRLAQNTFNANFGTTPARNAMVMELADQNDELVLDIESIFEANSPHGLVGFNLFVDFLHPNLAGHQLLARSVFEFLRDRALPAGTWQEPGALASPDEILAEHPTLGAQELRIRIVAEVMNERTEIAAELIAELRLRFPEDPELERLEAWLAGVLPFDFDLVY